ncbi:GNAT family N-acetyltransferase [Celerinatantimonas sp. MCCC 1A17872]|uniref:GNAT family N-acetyltransferase n=1 Tax=Celerinatantimonas sp. MCCC 1A17872 TaxID=3177514 RepID=UPI0038C93FB2
MLQTASKTICSIRPLEQEWCGHLYDRFSTAFYPSEPANIDDFHQQLIENCESWIALRDQKIIGFICMSWDADFHVFKEANIPEITTLVVLPEMRRQGVATALMSRIEPKALRSKRRIGMGVSLSPAYQGMQQLCAKRGFIPTSYGLYYKDKPVEHNQQVYMNEHLQLYYIKQRL